MSHFPVLVIGDDVDAQLAPYDENTEVEPYLDSADGQAGAALKAAMEYVITKTDTDHAGWSNQQYLDAYYGEGYWTVSKDGERFEHWSTYNKLSKWDWWVVGGRWEGFLRTRSGAAVNECTVADLDLGEDFTDRVPFAVVKDGEWLEAGRMGWFAVVLDRKDDDAWEQEVRALLRDLPPETRITSIDAHI